MERKFSITVLGCPKNECDAEHIAGKLAAAGCRLAADGEEPDDVIILTCGFTADAREESTEVLRETAVRLFDGQRLFAAGCAVSREPGAFAGAPGLSGAFPVDDQAGLIEAIAGVPAPLAPRVRLDDAPYAYLKLADGCDRACSFCSIPLIKGGMRPRSVDSLLHEASGLAAAGAKELVLVSQDCTAAMCSLGREGSRKLLEDLAALPGVERLRLMYACPEDVDEAFLELYSLPAVCRYLDLPMQHVSAGVLRAMNRSGDEDSKRALLERVRAFYPDASLRLSFIVGHPGESEDDFLQLLDFMESAEPDWLALFRYSPEAGTKAASMPGTVPTKEALDRLNEAGELAVRIMEERRLDRVGSVCDVLIEGREEGYIVGRTQFEAPEIDGSVLLADDRVKGDHALEQGLIIPCLMTGATGLDLTADPLF